jgi:hypothetical protein
MPARLTTLAVVSFLFTACGGAGAAGSAGLAYGLPSPTSATYVTGDTVVIDMNAMGQIMQESELFRDVQHLLRDNSGRDRGHPYGRGLCGAHHSTDGGACHG